MGVKIDRTKTPHIRRSATGSSVTLHPGANGPRGPKGDPGAPGTPGTNGKDGAPGGSDQAFHDWIVDPDSQTSAALSGTYAPRVGRTLAHVEGVPWYAYGHSYLAQDSRCSPGARYINRLNKRHNPASLTNNAVGGTMMQQNAQTVVGANAGRWDTVADKRGIVVLDSTANDLTWRGGNTTHLTGYTHSLRAILATLSAGSRIEETDAGWTYTGTWAAAGTNGRLSGSNAMISPTTGGEQASVTFTGTEATLLSVGFDTTSGHDVGELVIDGNVVATQDTGGVHIAVGGISYIPLPIRVTGLTNTTHTLTWRRKGTRTGNIWLDALLLPAVSPPTVVVVKQPYLPPAGYALQGATPTPTDATVDSYNSIIDTVSGEFSNVVTVDPNAYGWDRNTMLGADGLHPNDRGMAQIADAIEATLAGMTWTQGMNRLTD